MTAVKIGFYHDAPLVQGSDGLYYSSGFPYRLWERYLRVFDEIRVSTRLLNEGGTSAKLLSSGEGVTFEPIASYRGIRSLGLHYSRIRAEVRSSVDKVDAAIVRLPSILGMIAYSEARRANKPIFVEMVQCPRDAYWYHSSLGKLVAPLAYARTRHDVRKADFVLYVTQKFLQERYPTAGAAIGCSDAVLNMSSDALIERLERYESLDKSSLILATIGAVDVAYKGHEYVLRAIARLREKMPSIEYWIIGSGDTSRLHSLAVELGIDAHVRFLGTQPHPCVVELLKTVDLYVHPSLAEGLPRSVLEAFSVGCPVLASRAGGIPELVDNKWLFDPGDVSALAQKIDCLDRVTLQQMARRNYETVSTRYDPEVLERRRTDFLREFRGVAEKSVEEKRLG